jgi:hypothetical protein
VRTKGTQKTHVGVWGMVYGPRGLLEISIVGPEVDEVLQMAS